MQNSPYRPCRGQSTIQLVDLYNDIMRSKLIQYMYRYNMDHNQEMENIEELPCFARVLDK